MRNQKKNEAQMLSEALLDAEVKPGELLKRIPKAVNQFAMDSGVASNTKDSNIVFDSLKPKHEVVKELGFTPKQAQRFEILANNQDIVEQVKQEARENDDIPTRTRVIDLAQRRSEPKKQEQTLDEFSTYMDKCHKTSLKYHDALYKLKILGVNESTLKEFAELAVNDLGEGQSVSADYVSLIQEAIPKLLKIEKYLKEAKWHGKSNHNRT